MKIYTHPIFYQHDTGVGHPENSARIDAAIAGVHRAGFETVNDSAAHADTERIIAKVHSADYERQLDEACRAGMRLFHSIDNPISSHTFAAARAAVSAALTAAEATLAGERTFVVARPPGHHAERLQAMGFCFFNTIACVAEWMREQEGIERVFIFDFDVHHGNGTQHLFEERDDVYYASIHRYPFYPGTGSAQEIGVDEGRGFTTNIPLAAGLGDAEYMHAVEEVIVRVIDPYIFKDYQGATAMFVHLCFSVPSAALLFVMLFTGLKGYRRVHVPLGLIFLGLWAGTFVTGVFFLPHSSP